MVDLTFYGIFFFKHHKTYFRGINIFQVIDLKHLKKVIPYFIITVTAIGLVFVSFSSDSDSFVKSSNSNMPVIIIDAGHGGADGGAVADDNTQEQYINLDIALKMNDILTELGYETIMTRTDDNSIHDPDAQTIREKKVSDLHNRLKIIQSNPDSIFVSVHQNHFSESKYSGTQVFYSGNNPKSENLAQMIQQNVKELLQPENKRVIKESGDSIFLLYNSEVPSVLVECGFLSNLEETEKLKNEEYRLQMAEAVCKGIIEYLNCEELSSSMND